MTLNIILQPGEMGLNLGHVCTCGLSTTLGQHLSVTACLMLVVSTCVTAVVKATLHSAKIVSEYDQEIPQSQTADNPVAPRGRAAQPPRDTRKTN